MLTLLLCLRCQNSLMYKDGKLTGSQRQRGMYIGAGSEDIGRDPDWDPETNTWKGSYLTPHTSVPALRPAEVVSESDNSK